MTDNDRQRKAYYIVEHAFDDGYDTSKFTKWVEDRKSKLHLVSYSYVA